MTALRIANRALRRPILLVLLLCATTTARAQTTGARAFGIEAAGAAAGSALGAAVALGATTGRCDVEDVACILGRLGLAGATSATGAGAGAYLAGRANDTDPSPWGVSLGAIVGVAAGVGVLKLFEEGNVQLGKAGSVAVYAITHGIVTALVDRMPAFR